MQILHDQEQSKADAYVRWLTGFLVKKADIKLIELSYSEAPLSVDCVLRQPEDRFVHYLPLMEKHDVVLQQQQDRFNAGHDCFLRIKRRFITTVVIYHIITPPAKRLK